MKLSARYDCVLEKATEFKRVVTAVSEHPSLPAPGGVGGSKMTWRKQVGATTYLGWIMRLASEVDAVIFSIHFTTPDTHPMLVNNGEELFDELLPSAASKEVEAVVARFAEKWSELTKEDRHAA